MNIKLKDEFQNFVSNVLNVSSLHQNLLSIGKLSKNGMLCGSIRISIPSMMIKKKKKKVYYSKSKNNNCLFSLTINYENLIFFSSIIDDNN